MKAKDLVIGNKYLGRGFTLTYVGLNERNNPAFTCDEDHSYATDDDDTIPFIIDGFCMFNLKEIKP